VRSPLLGAVLVLASCRDVSRFSSRGDHFEGSVVTGSFVRSGIPAEAKMCLVLDTDRLQDAPGFLTSSDGRFKAAPLRPIPQIWHDPLSTLKFGDGRLQNLVYVAEPVGEADVMVVLSLMQSEHVEVRILRGAPRADAGPPEPMFGIFDLARQAGPCSF
jgi:hypothetical protein